MGQVGVEPTPADFQSAASTELASVPKRLEQGSNLRQGG